MLVYVIIERRCGNWRWVGVMTLAFLSEGARCVSATMPYLFISQPLGTKSSNR